MRLAIVLLTLCVAHRTYSQNIFNNIVSAPVNVADGASSLLNGLFGIKPAPCTQDALPEYRKAISDFHNKLYTHIAARTDNHFVFSPYTVWLSLSALAEGADPSVQAQIFKSLNLPQDKCVRQKFYDIALHVEHPGRDVTLRRRRTLLLDNGIRVNPVWAKKMRSTGLLNYSFAPIKSDPKTTSALARKFLNSRPNIAVTGNSVLLDSLDYAGLWTTAFPEASIRRQPFYNEVGVKIGTVEMMHIQKQVRLAHVPFMSAKVLELPIGTNGRFTMLIAMGTGDNIIKNAFESFLGSIMEIFTLMQMSMFPLDVAIPIFSLTSEFDLRPALEDSGVHEFWTDPAATRYVSDPPAAPGGYIQRVSVKVGSAGVSPLPTLGKDLLSGLVNLASKTATGVATAVGHDFIADRPFMFAFFDTATHTCLYAGAFARPNSMN